MNWLRHKLTIWLLRFAARMDKHIEDDPHLYRVKWSLVPRRKRVGLLKFMDKHKREIGR